MISAQQRLALAAGILVLALLPAFLLPAQASAQRIWSEGTPARPLSVQDTDDVVVAPVRGEMAAILERKMLWEYRRGGAGLFEPFSLQGLENGNVLIASRSNEVLEVTRSGRVVWSYTRLNDNPSLLNVYSAQRLPNGNTLITDRRADFVIEVNPAKQIVWRYGVTPESLAPGSLVDPFNATRLPNGNTLITDNRFATRVLEIRSSDYDPTAPNLGYTEASIVWRYGKDNEGGISPGHLASPRFSQRLPNGNTLITDAADQVFSGHRVIEISPTGEIVWQYGQAGVAGTDEGLLTAPSSAIRLANGNTLIGEGENRRVIEVDPKGAVVDLYGPGEFTPEGAEIGNARSIYRWPNGATLIADQINQRVIEVGYATSGELISESLTLGLPGVKKSIGRFEVLADTPAGTSVSIAYSLDGGPWVAGGHAIQPPDGATATTVRYRLSLRSASAASTPIVREVRIAYDVAPKDSKPPAGGGAKPPPSAGGSKAGKSGGGSGTQHASRPRHPRSSHAPGTAGQTGSGDLLVGDAAPEGLESGVTLEGDGDPTYARGTLFASSALSAEGIGLGGLGAPIGPPATRRALVVLTLSYLMGFGSGPVSRLFHR
ncbi:MAG: hypothetical protein RBS78_05145 [Coriobacteriia bacterium]|jgi:hypothetical protein|nr:hypothetical protein [Coriobacteriia bacterium]